MAEQGGNDHQAALPEGWRDNRAALLREVADGRDRAAALGLDLVRWFLDMAVLELTAVAPGSNPDDQADHGPAMPG